MSQAVDSKVVELSFDNQQFEQGCQTSMSTLDKLKQALKFDNAKNGLDEVASTANKMDLGGLGGAVETVRAKFSALDIMAMTALSNITNKAVDAGEKLVKAFTIDPVSDGFKEYELKMDSVQTIMAGSGAKVEEVNDYLNKLNEYSDKTIYSFKDMTASIGKFTNAGVELNTAVDAIQGIANEAARSGANASEASRAMYNFSQALSTGSVKLMDWKSIENANMATKEFKQELIDTAVALGTVVKDGDDYKTVTTNIQGKTSDAFNAIKDFNGSLQYQWMTSEVLTEALSHYAKNVNEMTQAEKDAYEEGLRKKGFDEDQIARIEQLGVESSKAATEVKTFSMMMDALKEAVGSGWAQTFEIIFGDLEEAKEMWTAVNNVLGGLIDGFSDARNSLLSGWDVLGGRTMLLIGLSNAFKGIVSVIKPIKEAFRDIFPPATAKGLMDLTTNFAKFTKRMKLSEESMNNLKNTFRGVFAIISLITKTFGLLTKAIFPAQTATGGLLSVILKVTGAIGNVVANTIQWVESSGVLQSVISGIASVAVPVFTAIKDVVTDAFNAVKSFVSTNVSVPDFGQFNSAGDVFKYVWENAKKLIDKVPSIEEMGNKIKEAFGKIQGSLGGAKEKGAGAIDKVAGLFNSLLGGKPDELKEQAKQSTKSFGEGIMEGLATIDVEKVLSGAKMGLIVYIIAQIAGILKNVRQLTGGFKKAAGELKKIPKQVTGILDKVKGTMVSMQNDIRANILLKVAIAIGILTASIIALTMVDSQKLANVAVDLALVIGAVALLAAVIGNILNKKGEQEDNPLVGVLDKFLEGVKKAAKKALSIVSKAAAFTLVAAAIGILAAVFIKLAKMKDDFAGAIAATAIMLAICAMLVGVVKKLNDVSGKLNAKTGVAIFLIATSIGKLGKTLMALSTMSWSELAIGLIGLASVMTMFGVFAKEISKADLTKAAAGLGMITLAMLAITPVIILFGTLSKVAMKGIVVVTLLGLAMSAITALAGVIGDKFGDKIMKSVGAMALLALTINLLAPTLMLLGATAPIAGKGLLVLAGALAVLLAAGAVAGIPQVTAGLTAMSATLVSFGSSLLMAGAGVVLFAFGLKTLIGVAAVVIKAISAVFAGVKEGAKDIGELGNTIAEGIVNLGSFLGELIMALGPIILAKIEELIAKLPGWLMTEFPKIVASLLALVIRIDVTILNLLVSIGALVMGALKGLWAGVVQGISAAAGPIGEAIKGLFMGFINLIVDGLGGLAEKIPGIGKEIKKGMDSWRDDLFAKLSPEEGKKATEGFAQGAAEGAAQGSETVAEAFKNTFGQGPKEVASVLPKEGETYGKEYMHSYAKGAESAQDEVNKATVGSIDDIVKQMTESTDGAGDEVMQNMFGDMSGEISSMQPQLSGDMSSMLTGAFGDAAGSVNFGDMMSGNGEDIVSGLAGGVDGAAGLFDGSMGNLATGGDDTLKGKLGISSPSKVMMQNGRYIAAGLAQGVKQGQTQVDGAFCQMATKAINAMKQQVTQFKAAGIQSAKQYALGITSCISNVSSTARSMSKAAAVGASGVSLYSTGQNMAEGFIRGLDSKLPAIGAAGDRAAKKYKDHAEKTGKINSPSRVMMKVGRFMGEGFIIGLNDNLSGIAEAGNKAAETAIEATKTPLEHIASILKNDINIDPTIRPVMDLSNIEEGASTINSLMPTGSVGLTFSAAGAVRGASMKMTNEDVVSAINGLKRELRDMPSGDTFNVNGVTYDDGSNVAGAVRDLIRAAKVERRA